MKNYGTNSWRADARGPTANRVPLREKGVLLFMLFVNFPKLSCWPKWDDFLSIRTFSASRGTAYIMASYFIKVPNWVKMIMDTLIFFIQCIAITPRRV